jgi:hypothetical protein
MEYGENMKRYIVITSIFEPTEAVFKFSKMDNYKLIVVGDKKSPHNWHCDNVEYISPDRQENLSFKLAKTLPYNHYCRKMLGYLKAIQDGAQYIIDTDDDNIPKENWYFPENDAEYDCLEKDMGFINIYQLYTNKKIWARGLPLKLINTQFNLERNLSKKECKVGVWQGLADEDPDVDAVYRLTDDTPCYFNNREPVILSEGTLSPFNTQNTLVRKELLPLMYLPTSVTFRFTDILRGLIAQPIMWLYDYKLGFINATVIQKRNPHNYMNDFLSEIPMYQHSEKVIEIVLKSISSSESIIGNIYNVYNGLLKDGIVKETEMTPLNAWLYDVTNLSL